MRVVILVLLLLLRFGNLSAASEPGADPGFPYKAPPGYVEQPPDAATSEYVFMRHPPGHLPGQRPSAILRMQVLRGLLDADAPFDWAAAEQADRDGLAAAGLHSVRFERRTMRWRSFELPLVVSYASEGTIALVTLVVHLPVAPRAVRIIATSRPGEEAGLKAALDALSGSIDSPTSWQTDTERSERQARWLRLLWLVPLFALAGIIGSRMRRWLRH